MNNYNILTMIINYYISQFEAKLIIGDLNFDKYEVMTYFFCMAIFKNIQHNDNTWFKKYHDEILQRMQEIAGENWDILSEKIINSSKITDLNEFKASKNLNNNIPRQIIFNFNCE